MRVQLSLLTAVLLSMHTLAQNTLTQNFGEDPWPNWPQERQDCVADNCARAVTGTCPCLIPYHTRRVDCASYVWGASATSILTATVTSVNVVATVTRTGTVGVTQVLPNKTEFITITTPPPVIPNMARRQVASTSSNKALGLPDYAKNYCDGAHYASACSCWGISQNATAAATWKPLTTVTVNSTSTTTVYATVSSVVSVISGTIRSTIGVPQSTTKPFSSSTATPAASKTSTTPVTSPTTSASSGSPPSNNLVANPGFEIATEGSHFKPWHHTGGGWAGVASDDESSPQNSATAHGGTHFASISNFKNNTGGTYLSQDLPGFVQNTRGYSLTFFYQTVDQAQDGCHLRVMFTRESTRTETANSETVYRADLLTVNEGDHWTKVQAPVGTLAGSGLATLSFVVDCDRGVGGMFGLDDVEVVAV